MTGLVARQPILDRQCKLYAYELLFRSTPGSQAFDGTSNDLATKQVLSNTLMSVGVDRLLGGKLAFVNFDYDLLREDIHLAFRPESIVIELLETVEPTRDLIALCQSITQQGYTIALDDFTDSQKMEPLTHQAKLIKVDTRLNTRQEQERLLRRYKPEGILMLAEKVETHEEYNWARRAGYDLFQGYFFARPEMVVGTQLSGAKTACLQLLSLIQRPPLDFQKITTVIKNDVSLSYKLLRYANSAMYQGTAPANDISKALRYLGEDGILRWATLASLPALATNKPHELLTLALVRAHYCERVAELANQATHSAHILGMFSLLDAMVDQPFDQILRDLPLEESIASALKGVGPQDDFLSRLSWLVRSFELGEWDAVKTFSEQWGVPPQSLTEAYWASTAWAETILQPA